MNTLSIANNSFQDTSVEVIPEKLNTRITRPGCFCAKDCLDSVEMYKWWYTFTCTGGGVL